MLPRTKFLQHQEPVRAPVSATDTTAGGNANDAGYDWRTRPREVLPTVGGAALLRWPVDHTRNTEHPLSLTADTEQMCNAAAIATDLASDESRDYPDVPGYEIS